MIKPHTPATPTAVVPQARGADIIATETIVSRVRCRRCGRDFYPRSAGGSEKGTRTKCPGCGDWMIVPKVQMSPAGTPLAVAARLA